MATLNPEDNARYATADDLHPLAWEELERRAPVEAAAAAGAEWDGAVFRLSLLGRTLEVTPGERKVLAPGAPDKKVGYQRALVAVSYLARALEVDPRGDWVTFRELPGGDGFFRGPHALATPELESYFGAEPESLLGAVESLGGVAGAGGDVGVELSGLPRIPLRVLLWAGTDEFPPTANVLTDARAYLHLPLDVLWALTNLLVADLTRRVK